MKRFFLFFLLAAQALGQGHIADELIERGDGTRIEIRSVFDPMPPTGYAPLRIVATNGSARDEVWQFDFKSQTQEYRHNNVYNSSLKLPVAASSTQSALFLAPVAPDYGNRSSGSHNGHAFFVSLSGPSIRQYSEHGSSGGEFPAIAISKTLGDISMNALEDAVETKRKSKSSYYGGSNTFGSSFLPEELPEDWLGVSGFDVVMMTDTEWQVLKPGTRNALLHWARLGGVLHFYVKGIGYASVPPDNKSYGLGEIYSFTWNGQRLEARETVDRYWNGRERSQDLISGHTSSTKWELLTALGKRNFNSWQVVVFLVIFGVLVGPVNLFVLAPSGKRHRLFLTTPLLSLGASAVMVGLILFQDGIGGIGARAVHIHLEPDEASAYVTQKQVSRTGVLFGAGFEMKQPALIEPLALPSSAWVKLNDNYGSQPVNLTQNGTTWGGNFFQSRAEQGQMIRAVVPTRARLEVRPSTEPDAPPEVVSALGFTVEEMFYVDASGVFWRLSSPLVTGQKASLVKTDPAQLAAWWKERQTALKVTTLAELTDNPRNHFFAKAKAAPGFTQETLSSIRWLSDEIIVSGSVTPP